MARQAGTLSRNGEIGVSHPPVQKMHDDNVTFEEYLHYASITRADTQRGATHDVAQVEGQRYLQHQEPSEKEKETGRSGANTTSRTLSIPDEEYIQASRAGRTASWGAVFYLITTDVLGPYSTGGGFLLWKMFLELDSDRYPLKNYGDVAYRLVGQIARQTVNIIQSVQLIFNVGIIIVSNGQGLAQISKDGACFIILCFVWALAGMILGQIRTLARLGWLANAAVWMNVFVMIATMAIVANTDPNYDAALANNFAEKGPVVTTAGPPDGLAFDGQVDGLMQAVFSYGGAMLFIEFLSEMKKPWDFWKGMLFAQLFIFVVYLFFGLFVYSFQGQFTINPAYQGISSYAWQTVANSISLVSTLIAALLYGNIGIKVIYNNVLQELFKVPALGTRTGKLLWIAVVPVYWGTAFVIAAAIPQFSNLSSLIGAACILQFSYTFPPFFMLVLRVKKDAMQAGDGFDPQTRTTTRLDSGLTRWKRGFSKRWAFNSWNLIFCLGSAATAVLGIYSAAKGIKDSYAAGAQPSFSCRNPVGAH
ncbi:hypothetical protein MMC22_000288 [Lobaria immixta]|nr:hypothetical protein [Lobaria immixta]